MGRAGGMPPPGLACRRDASGVAAGRTPVRPASHHYAHDDLEGYWKTRLELVEWFFDLPEQ